MGREEDWGTWEGWQVQGGLVGPRGWGLPSWGGWHLNNQTYKNSVVRLWGYGRGVKTAQLQSCGM